MQCPSRFAEGAGRTDQAEKIADGLHTMAMIRSKKRLTSDRIIAMTDAQRSKLIADIEAESPEDRLARSKPLNARQRETWRRIKKKMGRPKIGKGCKPIAVSLEIGLLKRADAYAKRHGLKRAQLISQGLRAIMGESTSIRAEAA